MGLVERLLLVLGGGALLELDAETFGVAHANVTHLLRTLEGHLGNLGHRRLLVVLGNLLLLLRRHVRGVGCWLARRVALRVHVVRVYSETVPDVLKRGPFL